MFDFYILVIKSVFIGLFTGIVIAIPIGPAGLESVRWTITKGFRKGILVALGSFLVDVLDAVLINFGLLSWIETNKLAEAIFWVVSGIVTFYIGYKAIKKGMEYNLEKEEELLEKKGILNHPLFTGFIISITYPMTHFSWLTFSTTFIRIWRNAGTVPYVAFLTAMLCGIFICLTFINLLAAKGKKVIKSKKSGKYTNLISYGIGALGIGFFLYGIYKLYCYF